MHRPARVKSKSKDTSLFNYNLLPACANSCQVLQISEGNCLPPAAPTSNLFTYRNCVCQSDYLRSLHASGIICHDVCTDEDDEIIHGYYSSMCTSPKPTKTIMFISTFAVSSAAVESTVASRLINDPTLPTPAPNQTSQNSPRDRYQWLDHNGKYLATAAGIIFAVVSALLGIAYYRRRNSHNPNLDDQQFRGRLIALQPLTPSSAQPPHPNFAPPTPSYKFGDTIRIYAEKKNDEGDLERSNNEGPTAPVRSPSRTERLIRERIRTTGRPDIPISATPKIKR